MIYLPADAQAPAIARRQVSDHAVELPGAVVDDAMLLVSELVTNAVRHGEPHIVLRLRPHPPGIGVSVQDGGQELPELPDEPDESRPGGRGLRIVDTLATEWGIEPASPGKVVWFELHPRD